MGSEALAALVASLKDAGVMALHLEIAPDNAKAERIYQRIGFKRRPYNLMTWRASRPI